MKKSRLRKLAYNSYYEMEEENFDMAQEPEEEEIKEELLNMEKSELYGTILNQLLTYNVKFESEDSHAWYYIGEDPEGNEREVKVVKDGLSVYDRTVGKEDWNFLFDIKKHDIDYVLRMMSK